MLNATIRLKIKERCNKLSSDDFENLACWQITEAFNKAQIEWCRRNAHGENILREGDEGSTSRIDDLQKIITRTELLTFTDKGDYYQSQLTDWPGDYLRYKRIELSVKKSCCDEPKRMTVTLAEEGNVDQYLDDINHQPSYAWGYTFCTITGNMLNIYHQGQFNLDECKMIYYRQPARIQITNCKDPYTGLVPAADVLCEFKDDLVEVLIDDAAAILNGDTENQGQVQRESQAAERNN